MNCGAYQNLHRLTNIELRLIIEKILIFEIIRFSQWRRISTRAVLLDKIKAESTGTIVVEFYARRAPDGPALLLPCI
jgi:hypothetical protein